MTEHMANFTKLGLRFHQNASLIKNAYCNCETPILFQIFKQNFLATVLKMEREKDNERKEKEQ